MRHTASMLAVLPPPTAWSAGLDAARKAGVILAGPSAGAVCWVEGWDLDSLGPRWALRDGLRFLRGSFCPHYDSESLRRPRFHQLVGTGKLPDGYAADDGVGLFFTGGQLAEVVAAMPESRAFRVERSRSGVEETSLKPRLLRG